MPKEDKESLRGKKPWFCEKCNVRSQMGGFCPNCRTLKKFMGKT